MILIGSRSDLLASGRGGGLTLGLRSFTLARTHRLNTGASDRGIVTGQGGRSNQR